MKALVLVFLFLSVYPFGRHGSARPDFSPAAFSSLTKSSFKKIQVPEAETMQSVIVKNYWEEEKMDVVNDEDDEDLTQKLLSLAKSFSAFFCYLFILTYAYTKFSKGFSFYHFLTACSRKFIALRVLRL